MIQTQEFTHEQAVRFLIESGGDPFVINLEKTCRRAAAIVIGSTATILPN